LLCCALFVVTSATLRARWDWGPGHFHDGFVGQFCSRAASAFGTDLHLKLDGPGAARRPHGRSAGARANGVPGARLPSSRSPAADARPSHMRPVAGFAGSRGVCPHAVAHRARSRCPRRPATPSATPTPSLGRVHAQVAHPICSAMTHVARRTGASVVHGRCYRQQFTEGLHLKQISVGSRHSK
jgi:hypothetical protein